MNMVSFNISGIANNQVKTSLKNSLDKIEGVQSIDIDKTLGSVTVGYNRPADETQIKNCITESGLSLS